MEDYMQFLIVIICACFNGAFWSIFLAATTDLTPGQTVVFSTSFWVLSYSIYVFISKRKLRIKVMQDLKKEEEILKRKIIEKKQNDEKDLKERRSRVERVRREETIQKAKERALEKQKEAIQKEQEKNDFLMQNSMINVILEED